jgi:hypothetical protein
MGIERKNWESCGVKISSTKKACISVNTVYLVAIKGEGGRNYNF